MKIIFLLTLLSLVACAPQKKEVTKTKIRFTQNLSTDFPGGLYFTAVEKSSGKIMAKRLASSSTTFEFDNGDWGFSAIGWSGTNGALSGAVKCAVASSVSLKGGDQTLDLNVTASGCDHSLFGPSKTRANNGEFLPLKIHSCMGMESRLAEGDTVPPGMTCDDMPGKAKSFRLSLFEYDLTSSPLADKKNPISVCVDVPTNAAAIQTNIKLPFGSSGFRFPYVIEAFDAAACSGTVAQVYAFNRGFANTLNVNKSFIAGYAGALDAYLHSDVCTGDWITNTPFASGAFSGTNPNFICTAAQFAQMHNHSGDFGEYILGRDLDLGGATLSGPLSPTFHGRFDGMGFGIKNLTIASSAIDVGIIGNIIHRPEVSIRDLKLENINVTSTCSTATAGDKCHVGSLIGKIDHMGSIISSKTNIDHITLKNINVNYKGNQNEATSEVFVGGVIGKVHQEAYTSQSDNLKMRQIVGSNIHVNFNVANYNSGINYAGGAIGHMNISFSGGSGESSLEEVKLISSSVTGYTNVGGLVGLFAMGEMRYKNYFQGTVTGHSVLGGLAGRSLNSSINNSSSDATINPIGDTGTWWGYGGIAGVFEVNDGSYKALMGLNSNFNLTNLGGSITDVQDVGGLVGKVSTPPGTYGTVNIKNSMAQVNINVPGSYFGGLVGQTDNVTSGTINIATSLSKGTIAYNGAGSMYRGGIVGRFIGNIINRTISTVDVAAGQQVGGIVGNLQVGSISESSVMGLLAADNSIGGIVGYHAAANTGTITNSSFNGDIHVNSGTVVDCAANKYCGLFVGSNPNTNMTLGNNYSAGLIFQNNSGTLTTVASPPYCAIAPSLSYCTDGTHYTNLVNTYGNCGSLTGGSPFVDEGGECLPLFEHKWRQLGLVNDVYRIGNIHEPFLLDTPSKWNLIGGDAFLLSKTFKLVNDLDFSSSTFVPIGGTFLTMEDAFSGEIIPNKKALLNISFTETNESDPNLRVGIFRRIAGAKIGNWHDPLIVNGLSLDVEGMNVAHVGAIGEMNGGDVYMQVSNASYVGTSTHAMCTGWNIACGAGGLVGYVGTNHNYIANSSFSGEINLPSFAYVGGLIGKSYVSEQLTVTESFANVDRLIANLSDGNVGGLIGYAGSSGGGSVSLSNNYVWFKSGFTPNLEATVAGGFLGAYLAASSVNISANYVELSDITASTYYAFGMDGPTYANNFAIHTVSAPTNEIGRTGTTSFDALFSNAAFTDNPRDGWVWDDLSTRFVPWWVVYGFDNM
jgi:hypothetical protein